MPRGIYLTKVQREQLTCNLARGQRPPDIYASIFNNDPSKIYFPYLVKLCAYISSSSPATVAEYVKGPATWKKSGKIRIVRDPGFLLSLLNRQNSVRINVLRRRYNALLQPTIDAPYRSISLSTTYRTLHRFQISQHRPEIRNMRASVDLQLEHMKLTAYFPVSRFVSFDGMDNGPHKFKNNSCWGPVGIPAETKQYQIGTRFFSVLATYSFNGFTNWSIFESTTTSDHVVDFMRNKVALNKFPREILMFDNAKVNICPASLAAIDDVFNGLWRKIPPYSPSFNPIELGFSNIRAYIQSHDDRSVTDPVGLIHEAFVRYSENNPQGRVAANGNWAIYTNNNNRFRMFGPI
jgi:hypothetical protein